MHSPQRRFSLPPVRVNGAHSDSLARPQADPHERSLPTLSLGPRCCDSSPREIARCDASASSNPVSPSITTVSPQFFYNEARRLSISSPGKLTGRPRPVEPRPTRLHKRLRQRQSKLRQRFAELRHRPEVRRVGPPGSPQCGRQKRAEDGRDHQPPQATSIGTKNEKRKTAASPGASDPRPGVRQTMPCR